nr:hypothetical protein [Tanacetum cinerariifolium]
MHNLESPRRPYRLIRMDHHGVPPLSHAYIPDPVELDEHVPVYVPEPKHPEYHAPSDVDIQVKDQPYADDASLTAESPGYIADSNSIEEDTNEDSIDYPDEPEDGRAFEGFDETEPFEEDETAVTPPPPRHRRARIFVRPQTPMAATTQALIDAFAAGSPLFPLPPISPAYDHGLLGHRAAMIHIRDDILEEDMPPRRRFVLTAPLPGCDVAESSVAAAKAPRGQYDFVDTVMAGQSLVRSPDHDVLGLNIVLISFILMLFSFGVDVVQDFKNIC